MEDSGAIPLKTTIPGESGTPQPKIMSVKA